MGPAHTMKPMQTCLSHEVPVWSALLRPQIDRRLEEVFAVLPQTEVVQAARYVVQGGGHRWRGLMAVSAGLVFRPDAEEAVLPLAAALEMVHAASLVLDDLPSLDHAQMRRGKPCVHVVYPQWVVDLLPAFLVNLAYQTLAGHTGVPEGCRLRALMWMADMATCLAYGQELDLKRVPASASEAELMECHALKSGSLFVASLVGGGILCGAGSGEANVLREAGLKLGQAYQILDDIADGKAEEGKCTALTLWGPEEASARAKRLLEEALGLLGCWGSKADCLCGLLREMMARGREGDHSGMVAS